MPHILAVMQEPITRNYKITITENVIKIHPLLSSFLCSHFCDIIFTNSVKKINIVSISYVLLAP